MASIDYSNKLSLWGAERIERALDPRNWPHNRQCSESGKEIWRLPHGSQDEWTELCSICRTIDFGFLLRKTLEDNRDEVPLGFLENIVAKGYCAFCRLVTHTIREFTGFNELPTVFQGHRVKCDLRQVFASYEETEAGMWSHRAIWLVTVPELPCRLKNQSIMNRPAGGINCRPLNTPVPWSMKGVENFLLMKIRDIRDEENSDNDHPALRVKDSVNFGKVRSWLLRCECLQHPRVEGLPVKLRLIDVRRRCLVLHVPQNARYVALSYTWGKLQRNFLRALTSNVGGLTVQGSISPEDHLLPRTIRDAMVVVHNIGGQYLWVDSLCILQNDENDKAEQIDAMASIYVSAAFTIVAAAGHDADAGLPGVLETPREKGQHSEAVQGLRLVNQLRSAREVLDASWWNSRGWTYQERVLSKSMLIFSASQVYFKCPHQLTCEDIVSNGGFYEPNHPDSVSFMSDSVSFYNYQLAVANYTTRNLSSDFDGLRAFLGVADLLGSLLCSGFVFGLPESYFDMALLWHPKSDLRRRVNEGSNEPLFPSWAWAGWSGQIRYDYHYKLSSRILYRNFSERTNDSFHHENILPPLHWGGWKDWTREPRCWRDSRNPGNRQCYPHLPRDQRAQVKYAHPTSGYLQFWTQLVSFVLSDDAFPEELMPRGYFDLTYSDGFWKAVAAPDGQAIGVVHLNVNGSTIDFSVPQTFILLSRTTRSQEVIHSAAEYMFAPKTESSDVDIPWDQRQFNYDALDAATMASRDQIGTDSESSVEPPWNLYNVMMIGHTEGISTRLGIGVVRLQDFHKAEPQRALVMIA